MDARIELENKIAELVLLNSNYICLPTGTFISAFKIGKRALKIEIDGEIFLNRLGS